MSHKSELLNCFQKYVAMVSAQFGNKILRFNYDNGVKYTSADFKRFCEKEGIWVECINTFTPQQNPVAKRMNRPLLEKAKTMIFDAKMRKEFWGEAIFTTAYLINKWLHNSFNRKVRKQTPAEIWYSVKPDLSRLRVFGCKAHTHVLYQLRKKLD